MDGVKQFVCNTLRTHKKHLDVKNMNQEAIEIFNSLQQRCLAGNDISSENIEGIARIEPLFADASKKQFYRVYFQHQSLIFLMLPTNQNSSEETFVNAEDLTISQAQSFIEAALWLNKNCRYVPSIYAYDVKNGLILLSDHGSKTLWDHLPMFSWQDIYDYYQSLMDWLVQLEITPLVNLPISLLRQFDQKSMQIEALDFIDYGLFKGKQIKKDTVLRKKLFQELVKLTETISTFPKVLIHRDFQSKNIMIDFKNDQNSSFIVIDFQDMCIGPIYYDLASLLFDPYIHFEGDIQNALIKHYYEKYQKEKDFDKYIYMLQTVALQRLLKAAGRYARLLHRDNKNSHMKYFYPALIKMQELLASLEGFECLTQVIESLICEVKKY